MTKSPRKLNIGKDNDSLDELLQHRTRLGICVLLAHNVALSFARLKDLLGETDGNLGAHLRRLEAAGYIAVRKEFALRKPTSWYRLCEPGTEALHRHIQAMEGIIRAVRFG